MLIDQFSEAIRNIGVQNEQTSLSQSAFLGFDTETTGVTPGKDGIISATLVLRHANTEKITPENSTTYQHNDVIGEWLMNPHKPIHPKASEVNGFTDEFVQKHGAEPQEALKEITDIINLAQEHHIPLLAYNISFDITMLRKDNDRWNVPNMPTPYIADPLVCDRYLSHRRGKRNLAAAAEFYNVSVSGDFHNATFDTVIALDVMQAMSQHYDIFSQVTVSDSLDWHRSMYATWAKSYNEYLANNARSQYTNRNFSPRQVNENWF